MLPKLKVRIGNSKRERQRVLYNKVARQHCVWVIWHSFRFAHKHVNTFRVVFFLIRSTLPASFYDKQNACKSRILQTINALRQAAACHPWGGSRFALPALCSVAQFMPLAVLCVWQRQILLMPKCVCARIPCSFFFFLQQQIRFLCTNQTENIRQMAKQERSKA